MKGYNHLSIIERENIAKLQAKGLSKREISRRINRSHSTVIRELNRLKEEYSPSKAQDQYISNRKNTGRKSIFQTNPEAKEYAEFKLKYEGWLPDEVANRGKLESLYTFSTSTLYRAINSGIVSISIEKVLKFRGRRKVKKIKDGRGQIPGRKFIDERPDNANVRKEIGHWEADLVISKGRKGGLLTLVDRHSRYPIVVKVEDKSTCSILKAFKRALRGIPKEYLKTITVDNGKEFSGFKGIEKELGVTVYFCNPYCPWEKGSNENFNGILRQYFPKKTDFSKISDQELEKVVKRVKNRPRKILGYFKATEIFWEKIKWCA
jgi:IS30 family transposase